MICHSGLPGNSMVKATDIEEVLLVSGLHIFFALLDGTGYTCG
jgi:hypothetical protein